MLGAPGRHRTACSDVGGRKARKRTKSSGYGGCAVHSAVARVSRPSCAVASCKESDCRRAGACCGTERHCHSPDARGEPKVGAWVVIEGSALVALASDWISAGTGDLLAEACARTWADLHTSDSMHALYWYDEVASRTNLPDFFYPATLTSDGLSSTASETPRASGHHAV